MGSDKICSNYWSFLTPWTSWIFFVKNQKNLKAFQILHFQKKNYFCWNLYMYISGNSKHFKMRFLSQPSKKSYWGFFSTSKYFSMLNIVVSFSVWKSLFLWSQEFIIDITMGCFEVVLYGIRDHFSHLKVPGNIALPAILCLKEPAQGTILRQKEAAQDTLLCHKDPAQGARTYCHTSCLVP